MTLDVSLHQRPFLMRAGILDGKENALNVEQSNFLAFDVDEFEPGQLRSRSRLLLSRIRPCTCTLSESSR